MQRVEHVGHRVRRVACRGSALLLVLVSLPMHLEASNVAVRLVVADSAARCPLIVDSTLWSQEAKLTTTDALPDQRVDAAVSISGDTVLVGETRDDDMGTDSGAAYVFVRTGTTWSQQAKLTASDAVADALFGISVSVSGDTALVGANNGAAYVFVRSGTTWTQQAKLTESDAAVYDLFGVSVSISGDTALVGAYRDAGWNSGAAWVFVRTGTTWSEQAKLTASDPVMNDNFGLAVSIAGDTALVGRNGEPGIVGDDNTGAAYVFVRSGTTWSQQAKLTASDAEPNDFFGISVSISGETALVGAYGEGINTNIPGGDHSGAAYAFVRNGTTWTQQAKLSANDAGGATDRFGSVVSVSGDAALVGAYANEPAGPSSGAAYVFVRGGSTWTQQAKLTASDAAENQFFGLSVAVSGDTALVGNYWHAAYVFIMTPAADGQPCTTGSECVSVNCVDGLCCDTACGGGDATDCQACSVAAGASVNGACSPLAAGAPCGDQDDIECSNPDTCTGAGRCQPNHKPATTACGDQGLGCLLDDTCDGSGACTDHGDGSGACSDESGGTYPDCTCRAPGNGHGRGGPLLLLLLLVGAVTKVRRRRTEVATPSSARPWWRARRVRRRGHGTHASSRCPR